MKANDNSPVLLATYSSDAEARIVAGMLENAGIRVEFTNETFSSSVLPIGFNTIGGVGLMVGKADAARALELLAECGDD